MADFHAASREHVDGFDPLSSFGDSSNSDFASGGNIFDDTRDPASKPTHVNEYAAAPDNDISATLKASAKMLGEDSSFLSNSPREDSGKTKAILIDGDLFGDKPKTGKSNTDGGKKNATVHKKKLPGKSKGDQREGTDHRLGLGVDMFAELSQGPAGASLHNSNNSWLLHDESTPDPEKGGVSGLFDESEPGPKDPMIDMKALSMELGPATMVKEETKLLDQKSGEDFDDTAIEDLMVGKIMEREDDHDVDLFGSRTAPQKTAMEDAASSERSQVIQSLLQDDDDLERLERTSVTRAPPVVAKQTAESRSDDLFAMLGSSEQPADIVGDATQFDFGSYINSQGQDSSSDSRGGGGLFA